MKKSSKIILGVILLSFAVGLYTYFFANLPEQMASHWDFGGEVDGYLSKFWALFFAPLMMLGLWVLFIILPEIDPLKKNIVKFRKYYDGFIILIILFFFYIYLLTIAWSINLKFNMSQAMIPAVAILFYFLGVLMPKTKRNWFIGVRSPWTLSSEMVWDKTHKLAGKLFKIMALIILIGLVVPQSLTGLIFGPIILIALYLFLYSYLEFRKLDNIK